jgi:hypothetical protein
VSETQSATVRTRRPRPTVGQRAFRRGSGDKHLREPTAALSCLL